MRGRPSFAPPPCFFFFDVDPRILSVLDSTLPAWRQGRQRRNPDLSRTVPFSRPTSFFMYVIFFHSVYLAYRLFSGILFTDLGSFNRVPAFLQPDMRGL